MRYSLVTPLFVENLVHWTNEESLLRSKKLNSLSNKLTWRKSRLQTKILSDLPNTLYLNSSQHLKPLLSSSATPFVAVGYNNFSRIKIPHLSTSLFLFASSSKFSIRTLDTLLYYYLARSLRREIIQLFTFSRFLLRSLLISPKILRLEKRLLNNNSYLLKNYNFYSANQSKLL
jgi:hypothetical protein